MKLTSAYSLSRKIFWRMFNPDDGIRLFGYKEGFLDNGASVDLAHPSGKFQLEIKQNDLHGKVIFEAGLIFRNDSRDKIVMNYPDAVPHYPHHEPHEPHGGEEEVEDTIEGDIVIVDGFPPGGSSRVLVPTKQD